MKAPMICMYVYIFTKEEGKESTNNCCMLCSCLSEKVIGLHINMFKAS